MWFHIIPTPFGKGGSERLILWLRNDWFLLHTSTRMHGDLLSHIQHAFVMWFVTVNGILRIC